MALAEIRDESTLPHLMQLLKDPESNLSAAAALGAWGTPKALPGLLEAYKQPDSTRDLRLEILDAFAKIEDRASRCSSTRSSRSIPTPSCARRRSGSSG